ncbi:WD40-repeat-containing domain protein [Thermoascus aurantiacus ATCC 26904]
MSEETGPSFQPICVASTSASEFVSISKPEEDISADESTGRDSRSATQVNKTWSDSNYFKSAEWSPDGTTVITDSADHHIRTFVLPPDLLEERAAPLQLSPYSTLPSTEPTYAMAIYPFYNLQDPSTTIFLSSVRDHPIRLTSALAPTTLATYSLINPSTEAFITPHSILYPASLGGTHFLTGSDSLICLFDINRTGTEGPVSMMPTIPSKRRKIVGGGVGMKGIVSAMAINPSGDGVLAAGTFTRCIALYGSNGSGELIGTFTVAKTEADRHIGGKGVTQLLWSPCGRYLYIVERKSHGVLIYDIRVTGQLLGWLQGRKAFTNQRLKVDVIPIGEDNSHEIWAGGTDGVVRVWKNPVYSVGAKDPDWEWKVHDDPVTSAVLHPTGSVVATCSGQKYYPDYSSVDEEGGVPLPAKGDNSLKIWAL